MNKEELLANPENLVGTYWKSRDDSYFKITQCKDFRINYPKLGSPHIEIQCNGFCGSETDPFGFFYDDLFSLQPYHELCPESEWNEALEKTLARIREVLRYECS